MKNGIIISILTALIVYFYLSQTFVLKVVAIILTLIAIIYLFFKDIIAYNSYKAKISMFKEGVSNPFIDVNKVSWKILLLMPGVDKMTAKHIVYNRRHLGRYKNMEDFFNVNEIPEEKREQIKKYIVV